MYKRNLIALSMLTVPVYAAKIEIHGICDERPIASDESEAFGVSIGAITVDLLTKHGVPFIGSQEGINSIANTPTGADAMEVLSNRSMRAYGWCYEIDGIIPDLMPGELKLETSHKLLRWFFAFSEYQDGNWVSYCQPVFKHKPDFVCKEIHLNVVRKQPT